MACSPLMPEKGQHECKASYWWFSIHQNQSTKSNVEYYPYGDEVGAQNFQWENYTINWSPDLQRAVGPNGDLSRESVKGVFNGDTRKVTAEMLMRVHAKIKVIRANWKSKHPPTEGKD